MSKKETIWRYILNQALEKHVLTFTQKEIAGKFQYSTSTVFNSLKAPRKLGAVEVTGRFFRIINFEKLLILWATQRNLEKDVVYSTYCSEPARKIEGNMPPDIIFAAFSAYRMKYNEAPADYDVVYVYSQNLVELKKRFPTVKGIKNLFILKPDNDLKNFGKITPDVQTFVDLWNINKWYAKDFLDALKQKFNL